MAEFDLSRNPFSQFNPKEVKNKDDWVTTTVTLNIRHYPTEEFIIREAVNECGAAFNKVIQQIFAKFGINRPKEELLGS